MVIGQKLLDKLNAKHKDAFKQLAKNPNNGSIPTRRLVRYVMCMVMVK